MNTSGMTAHRSAGSTKWRYIYSPSPCFRFPYPCIGCSAVAWKLFTLTDDEISSSYQEITLHNLEKELESAFLEEDRYENQVSFFRLQIERFSNEHPNRSKDILEFAELVRARDVLQLTVNILLERREEARIQIATEQGGIKVIDKPRLPTSPIPQNKARIIIMGILTSIGLGVIICIIVDRFDDTIKDEKDILQVGLPVFGTIPVLSHSKNCLIHSPKSSRRMMRTKKIM